MQTIRYIAIVAGSTLALATAAGAQTFVWNNATGGLWDNASNWDPAGGPPAVGGHHASINLPAPYSVSISTFSPFVETLTISSPLPTLNVINARSLAVNGTLGNAGTIVVNPTGGSSATYIQFSAPASELNGTGTLVLNATGGVLDRAYLWYDATTNVVTHHLTHTIRGTGNIYVGMVNNGTISADVDGAVLQLLSQDKSNDATIQATGGGILRFSGGIDVDNTGGVIRATGAGTSPSRIEVNGATITAGDLNAEAGTTVEITTNSAVDSIAGSGTWNIQDSRNLAVRGAAFTHTDTINVNPTGGSNATFIQFDDPATLLTGGGEIVLNATGGVLARAYLWYDATSNVATIDSDFTVRGSGNFYTKSVNNGLIAADVDGSILQLLSQPKTNAATIEASGGGIVQISGITVDNTGGEIRATGAGADPSRVELDGAIITAGDLNAETGTTVEITANSTVDSITGSGEWNLVNSRALFIAGPAFTHSGTVTVNPTGGASSTQVIFDSPAVLLTGGGEYVLNATGNVLDRAFFWYGNSANVATIDTGYTVRGSGNIYTRIVNNGLISADKPGETLQLLSTDKINNNLIQVINGAALQVGGGITVTQTGGGAQFLIADGDLLLNSATIDGGIIDINSTNGSAQVTLNSTIDDVTVLNGPVFIDNARVLTVRDTITNHGTTQINSTGGSSATYIRRDGDVTFDGSGEVVLNAAGGVLTRAYIWYASTVDILTNGANHTIAGIGYLYGAYVNDGVISPGHATLADSETGELCVNGGSIDCEPTSVIDIQLAGLAAGQFDLIGGVGAATFECDGTLNVTHLGGYAGPGSGESIDIIVAPGGVTGTFDTVNLPAGAGYDVVYLSDRVRLETVDCPGDLDGDGSVGLADLAALLANYGQTSGMTYEDGDLDGDGDVDLADLATLLAVYGTVCG